MIYVDTNIILDVLDRDANWSGWSAEQLKACRAAGSLVSGYVVAAELATQAHSSEELSSIFETAEIELIELNLESAHLAGNAFREYKRRGGERQSLLADFLIGAHALALGATMLSRDSRSYRSYFPSLPLITPEAENG
jgi:predicted nucleic acid-binding protein